MLNDQLDQELFECLKLPFLIRNKLMMLGYEPIPVLGKAPKIASWSSGDITQERIVALTTKFDDHPSTGLRTGRLIAPDIDLWNDQHAEIIQEVVFDIVGPTRLRRRGRKGVILCYRLREVKNPLGKSAS